jgi:hypothetical protein
VTAIGYSQQGVVECIMNARAEKVVLKITIRGFQRQNEKVTSESANNLMDSIVIM